jgi:hypothetical protein
VLKNIIEALEDLEKALNLFLKQKNMVGYSEVEKLLNQIRENE